MGTTGGLGWAAVQWVRVAAVAERLWSPRELTDKHDMERRMNLFRCQLIARDINVRRRAPNPSPAYSGATSRAEIVYGSCHRSAEPWLKRL